MIVIKEIENKSFLMLILYGFLHLTANLSGLHYFIRQEHAPVWLFILSLTILIADFTTVFRQKVIYSEIIKNRKLVFTIIQFIICALVLLSLKSVIAIHFILVLNFIILLLVVPTVLWAYGLSFIVDIENAVQLLLVLKAIELMIWMYRVKKSRTKTVV